MNKNQSFVEIDKICKSNIDKFEKSLNYNEKEKKEALLLQKKRFIEVRKDLNENFDPLNRKCLSILELSDKLHKNEILENINHIYNYIVATSDEYIYHETEELITTKPEFKDIIFEAYQDTIFKDEHGINKSFLDKLKLLFLRKNQIQI